MRGSLQIKNIFVGRGLIQLRPDLFKSLKSLIFVAANGLDAGTAPDCLLVAVFISGIKYSLINIVLFTDYMSFWLNSVKDNIDTVTFEGYKSYIDKHIRPYFDKLGLKIQDVKLSDIEDYYHYKATAGRLDGKEGGLSYRTIKLHSVVLNLIFNEAVRNSIISDNPCRLSRIPRAAARNEKKIEFYTIDQCKVLLEITKGTPLHDMIYLTFVYGLRRSELMGLRWSAVDFSGGTLSINHTVVLQNIIVEKDSTKNKASNRIYPLLDDVRSILLKLKEEQARNRIFFGNCYEENDYVFVREDGAPFYPSYPTHALEKVLKTNNLPHIRWHDLRHSCASMLSRCLYSRAGK